MKTKKYKRSKLRFKILFFIVTAFVVMFLGVFLFYKNSLKAVQSTSEVSIFTVENGSSAKKIIQKLHEEGFVKNEMTAYYYAKMQNFTDLKAGDYELDKSWDLEHILSVLSDSQKAVVNAVTITIIEGDWAKDIASKIAQETNVSAEDLLTLWNDETYLKSLESRYPFLTDDIFNPDIRVSLEGYLAPNTYQFFRETTAQAVTEKMLDQSLKVFNQYRKQMEESQSSFHEIYTMASIVQYEASDEDNMRIIAAVFDNRLRQNMPLQSSVTVCYAINLEDKQDWKSCESAKNAKVDSPYNTYKNSGLPVGPIMNPGAAAIEAVLNPSANDYLYFAADVYHVLDGKVHYAKTYEEHLENVRKLKLNF